jgi:hypothetical protein
MIKFIILNFGYVEDSHPYSWIYEHEVGFETKFEAALSLAADYYQAYAEGHPLEKMPKCCVETNKNNDKFCKNCGKPKYEALDLEPFAEFYRDWLIEFSERHMDGSEVVSYFEDHSNWCSLNPPYGITKENSLYIGAADKILIGLLYKTGLGDHVDEDIAYEILSRTDLDKFKASFEEEDGPHIYGN